MRASRQKGYTLAMTALFIVVLFTFAALAVDLGVLYTSRTSAQHAADAAALAGAYTFITDSLNATDTEMCSNAQDAAVAAAAQNKVLGTAVTITGGGCPTGAGSNVLVDTTNRRVTVTVPLVGANGVATYFARVIGWNRVDVATKAVAEASKAATSTNCLKPFFLPNTILSSLSPQGNPSPACSAGQLIFDPTVTNADGSHPLSAWFLSQMPTMLAYTPGSLPAPITIRPTSPSGALAPSQYYSLDLAGGSQSGSVYKCTIANCLNACPGVSQAAIDCNTSLPVLVGNKVGPTQQGVNNLLDSPNPDTFYGVQNGEFVFNINGNSGDQSNTSQQQILVAVWDDCPDTITSGYHGQNVPILGFANFFVTGWSGGGGGGGAGPGVQGYFLFPSGCNVNGTGTGPQALPVRLIQNNE